MSFIGLTKPLTVHYIIILNPVQIEIMKRKQQLLRNYLAVQKNHLKHSINTIISLAHSKLYFSIINIRVT